MKFESMNVSELYERPRATARVLSKHASSRRGSRQPQLNQIINIEWIYNEKILKNEDFTKLLQLDEELIETRIYLDAIEKLKREVQRTEAKIRLST